MSEFAPMHVKLISMEARSGQNNLFPLLIFYLF